MPHRIPINPTEQDAVFVAKAIAVLSGPAKRTRTLMRAANLAYYTFLLVMVGWLISQAMDRQPPIRVSHFSVDQGVVYPGEQLTINFDLSRDRICEAQTEWAFYDGANEVRRFGPSFVSVAGKIGPEKFRRSFTVPANSAPGVARLVITLSWQCPGNYLHPIYPVVMTLPDINFTIAARR